MGRFSYEDADKYGGSGDGGNYFKLSKDKECARVQLLGNDMKDFPGYAVHQVKVGDKNKWVNCLREYNDPVDVCPFCKAKIKQQARVFIPLYNVDKDEIQMWDRGKSFFATLAGYCTRNPKVVSIITEIERHGKENDTNTTYQLYSTQDKPERDRLEDFEDEIPEVLGRYVLDKTADDMEYYLDEGRFPATDSSDSSDDAPRRRSSRRDEEPTEERRRPSRRRRDDEDEY